MHMKRLNQWLLNEKNHHKSRARAGNLASLIGLLANLLLAAVKLAAGSVTGSVAVTADGVNNLSDSLSSLLTMAGFYLSARPADGEHPYGHLRAELLLSVAVGFSILLVGGRLLYGSVLQILQPAMVTMSTLTAVILLVGLAVKGWMFLFFRSIGAEIDSAMLQAAAYDSLSDVLSGSAVLLSLLLSGSLGIALDGWMGAAVSLLIIKASIQIIRENVSRLLGHGATREESEKLLAFILKQPGILGVHDLMIHDYGPGRRYAAVDCYVEGSLTVEEAHQLVDAAERAVAHEFGLRLVIHMDPMLKNDRLQQEAKKSLDLAIHRVNRALSYHDLRAEREEDGIALYFDLLVPGSVKTDDDVIKKRVKKALRSISTFYRPVIRVERMFE